MPRKRLLFGGLLLLALFVLIGFPASSLWRWNQSQLPEVELSGVSGTLWRGQADQLIWRHLPLGQLDWQWQTGWPPRWDINLQGPQLDLQAQLWPADGWRLQPLRANWDATLMRSPLPGARFSGRFHADFSEMMWQQTTPQRLQGQIRWRDARLLAPLAVNLGEIHIALTTATDFRSELRLQTIAGSAADLVINGSGVIADGRYQLTVDLRADRQRPQLTQWLDRLGTPTADGSVRVQLSGPLQ
ncbi:MAG: hypothetical protein Tsb002_18090 [Wenzhouxiangellaceae bacterium]